MGSIVNTDPVLDLVVLGLSSGISMVWSHIVREMRSVESGCSPSSSGERRLRFMPIQTTKPGAACQLRASEIWRDATGS